MKQQKRTPSLGLTFSTKLHTKKHVQSDQHIAPDPLIKVKRDPPPTDDAQAPNPPLIHTVQTIKLYNPIPLWSNPRERSLHHGPTHFGLDLAGSYIVQDLDSLLSIQSDSD